MQTMQQSWVQIQHPRGISGAADETVLHKVQKKEEKICPLKIK